MTRRPRAAALVAVLALTACSAPVPPARSRAAEVSAADRAACRTRADEIYAKQNRVDLSLRDQRDNPYASTGLPGNTSEGLGQRYAHAEMVQDCLNSLGPIGAAAGPNLGGPGTGPAMDVNSGSPDVGLPH
jgi:hypothetical protein